MAAVKMMEMLRQFHLSRHTTNVAKRFTRSLLTAESRDAILTCSMFPQLLQAVYW
jgi:hypothetical protein